jgi:hypothetical protein
MRPGFPVALFTSEIRLMKYVDGFVVAVPAKNKEAYRELAAKAAPLFKEFGALRVVECWADVPDGKLTDFRMAVKAGSDEEVGVQLDRISVKGGARRGECHHDGRPKDEGVSDHAV